MLDLDPVADFDGHHLYPPEIDRAKSPKSVHIQSVMSITLPVSFHSYLLAF